MSLHATYEQDKFAPLRDQLIRQHRFSLLGGLTALLAHEYNNIMTPMMARAQDAFYRDDPVAMRKALDRTVTQCQKAVTLSQAVIGLTREQPIPDQPFQLEAAVRAAIDATVRPFEKDRIDLTLEIPGDLQLRGADVLFEQLLLTLLLQARNAMRDVGGRITISARPGTNDKVNLELSDTRGECDVQYFENVLAPFLASDPLQDPCGPENIPLDYNVCRLIAHFQSADLSVTANEASGVRFSIHWPA